MKQYRGGCSCGRVRFELGDHPIWVLACHCDACKKRTGSAYGLAVAVENHAVKEFAGETKSYTRTGESGKEVRYEFCPYCGTTLRWHIEIVPGRQVFAGGAFDDVRDLHLIAEMYTDAALPWARVGCELSRPGASNDAFRKAMIEKSSSGRRQG